MTEHNWYKNKGKNCNCPKLHYTLERNGKEFRSMRIRELIDEYELHMHVSKMSQYTIDGRRRRLKTFCNWCEENGIENIEDISLSVIKKYAKHHIERGVKGATVNCYLKTAKFLIQFAFDEGYAAWDTRGNFFYVKEEKPVIHVYSNDDVKQLIKNCDKKTTNTRKGRYKSKRDRLAFFILFETGIRNLELCRIKVSDVNLDNMTITVQGKGSRERLVAVTKPLALELVRFLREREKMFPSTNQPWLLLSCYGKQMSVQSVDDIFKTRGAGMETDARISAHTCRHFYTVASIKNNVPLPIVQRQLGHTNLSITTRYTQALDNSYTEIAREVSVLGNL